MAVLQQFLAGSRGLRVTSARQQSFDLGAHGGRHLFQTSAGEALIAKPMPLLEQPLRLFQQVSSPLLRGGRSRVDQALEVSHQMSPAPLQPLQPPVHLGPVAADHARELVGQPFVQHGGCARRPHAIDREVSGNERPQPRLVRPLFHPCLVDVEHRLRGKLFAQFVGGGTQRVRHAVRELDRQSHAARLPQNGFEEQCRATFALTKAGPPQSDERSQSSRGSL